MNNELDKIPKDENGFLSDTHLWTQQIAECFASDEGLMLTEAHWEILWLVREFYDEFSMSPVNRALVKWVREKLGDEKGNSIYLMTLFPESPARVASRIAGLPRPHNCL